MNFSNQPIGVFDSGVGGLTVLDSLIECFPKESFIYVADQGHCPYGTKTNEQIKECAINVAKYLEERNVKMIIIACNTASLFVDDVRKKVNVPVISVIEATCPYALKTSKNKRIAVLGTVATINKGAYQTYFKKHGVTVFSVACSEFVDFIENCDLTDPLGQKLVNEKLKDLKDKEIDTLVHGCTHFSIIEDKMRKVLGDINYVACGKPTSIQAKEILENANLLNENNTKGIVQIYTTSDPFKVNLTMKWFKKDHEEVKHIDL